MNDDLKINLIDSINTFATKNTAEIRAQMKKSGLFNYRDSLLLELLNSEIQTADLMQSLEKMSLETVAGSPKFKDSKTIENLISCIIECKDDNLRMKYLDIFQKQICRIPENTKYLGKIFEDQTFVDIIIKKSLKEIDEYLKNNKLKDIEKIIKIVNTQNVNRRAQKTKDMNDRSQRRNKVFTELNKEKNNMQNIITEYNVTL